MLHVLNNRNTIGKSEIKSFPYAFFSVFNGRHFFSLLLHQLFIVVIFIYLIQLAHFFSCLRTHSRRAAEAAKEAKLC